MEDETQITEKTTTTETSETSGPPKPDGSHLFSISIRSLITLTVVVTVCVMSWTQKKIEEPLYTLVGMCIGYYFGQQTKPKNQQ